MELGHRLQIAVRSISITVQYSLCIMILLFVSGSSDRPNFSSVTSVVVSLTQLLVVIGSAAVNSCLLWFDFGVEDMDYYDAIYWYEIGYGFWYLIFVSV